MTRALLLLGGLWLCAACGDRLVTVGKLQGAPAADSGVERPAPRDAGATPAARSGGEPPARTQMGSYRMQVEPGAREQWCAGKGSALTAIRPDGAESDCAPRAERQLFAYALCACQALHFTGPSFTLDSFDSAHNAYAPGQTGAAVGVDGTLGQLADDTQILGNLTVAGQAPWTIAGPQLLVTGDLETNAPLQVSSGGLRIGRDLRTSAELRASPGSVQVDRHAYLPAAAAEGAGIDGAFSAGDYRAGAPCACGAAAPLDIAALVAQVKDDNDNAALGFTPDALSLPMYDANLKPLPCGRLYVTHVALPGLSTYILAVPGRSALFVQGDFTLDSLSTLFLTPGSTGELDVFVAGDLIIRANSSLVLGDRARPAAVRMYVAGQIQAPGNLLLAGQLYAPNATLELPLGAADVELYGAVFARELRLASKRMHYDRAILNAGPQCSAAPPQRCDGCNQCPGEQACISGACAACTRDADCCEPARCSDGQCRLQVMRWP